MANIFSMLLSGLAGGGANPPVDETEVEGITVMPKKKPALTPITPVTPPDPAVNPYTPDYMLAAQQASQAKLPRVSGGTDAGLYGFLPEKVRNSRFRDVLGAIGDGILMGGKMDPIYRPRVEQRRMGQALLGFEQDPQNALARLAQTGAPESIEMFKDMQNNLETQEIKKQNAEYLNEYRKGQLGSKRDALFTNMGKYIVPGILARAKTPELYASAYDRLTAAARRIDPDADATSAFGIPNPAEWEPEMTEWIGTTGGDQIRSDTTREGIAQRKEAATMSSADRRAAIAQRDTASQRSSSDRRAAIAAANQRQDKSIAAKSKPKAAGAKPPATGGGKKPIPANAMAAYSKGTPAQRAQAKKTWASQGFDTSKLK
jgi:hypothetical protein